MKLLPGILCVAFLLDLTGTPSFMPAFGADRKAENYCFIDEAYSLPGNYVRINTIFEGKDPDGSPVKRWLNVQCSMDKKKGCSTLSYNLLLPLTVSNPQTLDKWFEVASIVGPEAILQGYHQKITFNTKTGKATLFTSLGEKTSEAHGSCK